MKIHFWRWFLSLCLLCTLSGFVENPSFRTEKTIDMVSYSSQTPCNGELATGREAVLRAKTAYEGLSVYWSDPSVWVDGRPPGPGDRVLIPAGDGDLRIDQRFGGSISGLYLGAGFHGTLHLERDLTVCGAVRLDGGKFFQDHHRITAMSWRQIGGEFVGGEAPVAIAGAVHVTGGHLTTPAGVFTAFSMDIRSPGVVSLGAESRLVLTGDGVVLAGDGLLDTTSHTPNTVELSGTGQQDLQQAQPWIAFRSTGNAKMVSAKEIAGLQRARSARKNTPAAPDGAHFARLDSLTLAHGGGEDFIRAAVIDPAGGFAYFGTDTNPGIVVKVRLSDFKRLAALTLNPGEGGLSTAVIDTTGGYAYFGTASNPAKVIKIRLSDFSRVSAVTLNPGEEYLESSTIDQTAGYGYFACETFPGIVVKIRLSDMTRMGALTLNTGEDTPYAAVIDPAGGYAYFGTRAEPGIVVRLRLSDFTRVDALQFDAGEDSITSGVIDLANGYAYFATWTMPGYIVKVRLSDFSRVGSVLLSEGEDFPDAAVLDPMGGYLYVEALTVMNPNPEVPIPEVVVRVDIHPDTFGRSGSAALNIGEEEVGAGVLDPNGGYTYFGFQSMPGVVVKVDINPSRSFTRTDALELYSGENYDDLYSAVIDPGGGFAYFGTSTSPGVVVKVRLSDFKTVAALTLNPGEEYLSSAVIDPANNFAYFGTETAPGKVVKVRLSDLTRRGAVTFSAGEDYLYSAVIDPVTGYAYFGTETSPGIIVRVDIDPAHSFTRSSALTLNAREDNLSTAVIDLSGGFAYFLANPFGPDNLVRVQLSDFTRNAVLSLPANATPVMSSVIDPEGGNIYLGTWTTPGRVLKIKLSDFTTIETLTLPAEDESLFCAVIDPARDFAYFGLGTRPGRVARVRLSDLTLQGVVILAQGEDDLQTAVIDPSGGKAYFGTWTEPGIIVRIDLDAEQPVGIYLPVVLRK